MDNFVHVVGFVYFPSICSQKWNDWVRGLKHFKGFFHTFYSIKLLSIQILNGVHFEIILEILLPPSQGDTTRP